MISFKHGLFTCALVVAVALTGAGFAKNQYRLAAIAQYKLGPDRSDGTRAVNCTYCHVNSTGAAPWNPFGMNLRETFRNDTNPTADPELRIRQALYKVLLKRLDSDNDGYSDVLEVFADTLPGSDTSTPTQSVLSLTRAFISSGGYAQFKAR